MFIWSAAARGSSPVLALRTGGVVRPQSSGCSPAPHTWVPLASVWSGGHSPQTRRARLREAVACWGLTTSTAVWLQSRAAQARLVHRAGGGTCPPWRLRGFSASTFAHMEDGQGCTWAPQAAPCRETRRTQNSVFHWNGLWTSLLLHTLQTLVFKKKKKQLGVYCFFSKHFHVCELFNNLKKILTGLETLCRLSVSL